MVKQLLCAFCIVLCSGLAALGANWDPNSYVVWPNALDTRYELRVGAEWDTLEAYVAPYFDVSSEGWGIRAYGIYNALTSDMVAQWINSEIALPPGKLYAGIFPGWKEEHHQVEVGWLVGGKVQIKENVWLTTEYQQLFTDFDEDDDAFLFVTGIRIEFP